MGLIRGEILARREVGIEHHMPVAVGLAEVDSDVDPLGGEQDGRLRLEVGSNTVEMLARQLAGWEPEAEVEGPPEVRAALATLGRSLAARYAD